MNENKVPQLFILSATSKFNDPKHFPWTAPWFIVDRIEGAIRPLHPHNYTDAKIAVLHQNDDFGKGKLLGLREGLGDKADKMIVATQTYETSDPTINSQILSLRASGADVLFTAAIGKFHTQAIRKAFDIGWNPTRFVDISATTPAVTQPAGTDKSVGLISATYGKLVADPQWHDDPVYKMAGVDEEIRSICRRLR